MSADIKDISLNCGITSKLMSFKFVFLKIHKNATVLPICQGDKLINDKIDDLLKVDIAWSK